MGPQAFKKPQLSPLRYPGGKAALYPRLRKIIRENLDAECTYVEPYAGGAGAALGLLITGVVSRVVINDLDPAIFSFWNAAVQNNKRFCERIQTVELTVQEWVRQKEIYKAKDIASDFELGFATFYLNRTNRSGVLNGGPIGGKQQLGTYKIDARFNRRTLQERMRLIGLYANRIIVRNADGLEVIQEITDEPNVITYADPPYFEKSGSLYLNSFRKSDHEALAACLNNRPQSKWLLTYDDVPDVKRLYSCRRKETISLRYSAHRVTAVNEIMVYSDALAI